eukprot:5412826-Amphidinium_carterae.1
MALASASQTAHRDASLVLRDMEHESRTPQKHSTRNRHTCEGSTIIQSSSTLSAAGECIAQVAPAAPPQVAPSKFTKT